jgi:hypothetical protein
MRVMLFAVFAAGMLSAQSLPPGMTLHRLQAGVVDQSGWAMAESTQGAYSAKLPCTFNDFTINDLTGKENVSWTYGIGCRRPDGEKYSVVRVQYRNGEEMAKAFFDRSKDTFAFPGSKRKQLIFQGLPTVEVAVTEPTRCWTMRYLLAGSNVILMVAEAPAAQCRHLRSQVSTFFSSLVVKELADAQRGANGNAQKEGRP